MRVISGLYKGRKLAAPKGEGTRPTTDRVKESCMSALEVVLGGFEGAYVLDAFAGSGALGIEALSRGARFCAFCDQSRLAQKAVRGNLQDLKIPSERFRLIGSDVLKSSFGTMRFDVVLADPPYKMSLQKVDEFIGRLFKNGTIEHGALVLQEYATDTKEATVSPDHINDILECEIVFQKRYGETTVMIRRLISQESEK